MPKTSPPRVEVVLGSTPSLPPLTAVTAAKRQAAATLEPGPRQLSHSTTFSTALEGMAARQGISKKDLARLQVNRQKPVAEGVVRLFVCHNDYTQWRGPGGICTAASFAWAKRRMQGPVSSFSEVGNAHLLSIQQAVLRKMDDRPDEQTELAGLAMSGLCADVDVNTMKQVVDLGYQHAPDAVVFWSHGHTMAFWTDGKVAEFLDMERGCFFAKERESIERQMNLSALTDPPIGARVVRLPE